MSFSRLHRIAESVLLATVVAIVALFVPGLSAQTRTLTVDDLRLDVGLSAPAISPDGQAVVIVTSRPNYDDNRFDRTLVLVDVATGAQRDLTPQRPAVGQPRWSPSGDRLAFVDSSEGEGGPQLFVLSMSGGEAKQVAEGKQGVRTFRWTPDGSHLLYTVPDASEEREGEERHNRSFEVGYNSYLAQAAPAPAHVWKVSINDRKTARLTEGVESFTDLAVSPDGSTVALRVLPRPHSGESIRSAIRVLDLESGQQRPLVTDASVSLRAFSPDGKFLAFGRSRGREAGFHPSGIFLKPIGGGAAMDVTEAIDRSLGGLAWLNDQTLLVSGTDLTSRAFWQVALDGASERIDLGPIHPASNPAVAPDGTVAFIGREPDRPSELYVMAAGTWEPRRLTDFNARLASMRLGDVETITWDGPDGFDQNGILIYPPDFEEGVRYPLVLSIHGGPMGASIESFSTFNQILAAQGWLVFSPNYRGSSTQGDAFQSAVINDAGDGPGRDVMSGVDAVKVLGIVDDDRIAVSGWSYGGYMTAWLTAHYDGWAAAVAGASVTDWFDWYSMADMNVWAGGGLDGSPWLNDNALNYWRQSPMAYAHQISTPTLILHATGDERVTVSQSYKLYHALEDNGVETSFIAYPVSGHFPPDPVHRRDVRRRWVTWIAEHFERLDAAGERPAFELTDQAMLDDGNAFTNAIADYDNDGDLDLFVGFSQQPNRMYRNDAGTLTDVAAEIGLADNDVTRAAAWGDYDGDGHLDLFVGFVSRQGSSNRLYRNEGDGARFTDVTDPAGVAISGSFRQVSWVDYDNDGDVDLFLGLRDKPNVLFRNDDGRFTDVASALGVGDSRRTVGAVWFDFDKDGDLDLYVANMDGDANGLFRNDGTRFVDVAIESGADSGGRPLGFRSNGSVRPTLADYDNDGALDIFTANYGPNGLLRNLDDGRFENVAPQMGLAIDSFYDTGTWGDYDNDGRLDLYVNGTVTGGKQYRDYLLRNDGERFIDVTPDVLGDLASDHGAQWADFDLDGALDLALTGGTPDGMHYVAFNRTNEPQASRSLQVMVLDGDGRYTRAGSEVRVFAAGTDRLLGMGIVDTGSGYNSQSALPVHVGLAEAGRVDVEIVTMTDQGRKTARVIEVDPAAHAGRWLIVKIDANGRLNDQPTPR